MSTLLPFLYQTRTLQQLSRTGISPRTFRALLHSTSQTQSPRQKYHRIPPHSSSSSGGIDIPFELPEGYKNPDKKQPPPQGDGVRSTITKAEDDIFTRIFQNIAARKSPLSTAKRAPPSSGEKAPEDPSPPPTVPELGDHGDLGVRTAEPNPELIRHSINIIVQDASEVHANSRRHAKHPFDPLHPLEQTASSRNWEQALLRFPPRLREAARLALGAMEADEAAQKTPRSRKEGDNTPPEPSLDLVLDPLAVTVQNETLRRVERNRVEALMRDAKTDFALWDVLEAEVFPLVRKLGIDDESSGSSTNRSRKGKLPLHIYGPLYPAYLLSALRLFDTQFSRSSPLALHILPRVREMGPASYVLGVSTPFYNELARLLWSRYGDPAAVFNLLEEMRVAGLYCDETTSTTVHRIQQFFGRVSNGDWGPFLRELATLPEYQYALKPRIGHWLKIIQRHVAQRKRELHAKRT